MLGRLLVLCACLVVATSTPLPMFGAANLGTRQSGYGQFMQGAPLGGKNGGFSLGGQTAGYPQGGQMYSGQMYGPSQGGQTGGYPLGRQMYGWGQGGQTGGYPRGGQIYPQLQGGLSTLQYSGYSDLGAMAGQWASGYTRGPQIPAATWPSMYRHGNDYPDWYGHKYQYMNPQTGGQGTQVVAPTGNNAHPFYMQNWQATGVQPR